MRVFHEPTAHIRMQPLGTTTDLKSYLVTRLTPPLKRQAISQQIDVRILVIPYALQY